MSPAARGRNGSHRLAGARIVLTPEGLRVQQVGTDFVLGTWHDDMDVPYVRVYALHRGD